MKVVFHFDGTDALRATLGDVILCPESDAAAFERLLPDLEVLWHVLKPVTAEVIARAPKLKLIQKIGSGVNTIDVEAAKRRGIAVCNLPGTNSRAVAEMTLLLMLSCLRIRDLAIIDLGRHPATPIFSVQRQLPWHSARTCRWRHRSPSPRGVPAGVDSNEEEQDPVPHSPRRACRRCRVRCAAPRAWASTRTRCCATSWAWRPKRSNGSKPPAFSRSRRELRVGARGSRTGCRRPASRALVRATPKAGCGRRR